MIYRIRRCALLLSVGRHIHVFGGVPTINSNPFGTRAVTIRRKGFNAGEKTSPRSHPTRSANVVNINLSKSNHPSSLTKFQAPAVIHARRIHAASQTHLSIGDRLGFGGWVCSAERRQYFLVSTRISFKVTSQHFGHHHHHSTRACVFNHINRFGQHKSNNILYYICDSECI